jgi:putative FmdB family regulatory protein
MPTYEYACEKCGHQFDIFQSMKDKPLTVCPKEKCGKKTWGKGRVRKMLGAGAGLIFKGSGFYITDYRSESYKQAAKKESGGGSSESKSSGGADSKPAAKSEAKSSSTSASSSPKAK